VTALDLDTRRTARASTDEAGWFVLDRLAEDVGIRPGLPAGRWRVLAESTSVVDPSVTPILQPWIEAEPGDPGFVRVSAWLAPEVGWRVRLERVDSLGRPALVTEEDLQAGAAAPRTWIDRPEGAGPFRYVLTAWVAGPDGPAGAPWTAATQAIEVTAAAGEPLEIHVSPLPWNGRGTVTFRSVVPLRGGWLRIWSAAGAEVARIPWTAGSTTCAWNGTAPSGAPVPSGCYLYRVSDPTLSAGWAGARGPLILVR
jgi:hypothetical protein